MLCNASINRVILLSNLLNNRIWIIMITREQVYTMLLMNQRNDNLFFKLPLEVIVHISDQNQGVDTDIAKALHYTAYARNEDITALLNMLDTAPRLLLQSGNVQTPGGDIWKRVTIFEFCLGSGDFDLAAKIIPYFTKIDGGKIQMRYQYERYKPHIETMLTTNPYNLIKLFELIKITPLEEINALSKDGIIHNSKLSDAMIQFRQAWSPKILTRPSMHYNYNSLQHAYSLIAEEWDNLHNEKILFILQNIIGFEMRRLPGIDRCNFANGVNAINQGAACIRSYQLKHKPYGGHFSCKNFPVTIQDEPFSMVGLGRQYWIDLDYSRANVSYLNRPTGPTFSSYFNSNMQENTITNISLNLFYYAITKIFHIFRNNTPAHQIEKLKLRKYHQLLALLEPVYEQDNNLSL